MESEQKEVFRNALLRVLDGNRARFGLGTMALEVNLVRFGFPNVQEEPLLNELDYLVQKGLVEEVPRLANRENRTWRISRKGIAYIDEHNLG